nr:MAG TPA: hypothetical protein [Caudoviricetes sp.]
MKSWILSAVQRKYEVLTSRYCVVAINFGSF